MSFKILLPCLIFFSFACQEIEQPKTVLNADQLKRIRAEILSVAPTPKYPVNAVFDGKIELIGFDLDGEFQAGKKVTFIWYWKVLKPISKDWKAFVHLDADSGKFRQNLDHVPVENMYQTSQWKVGEIIRDKQMVTLKREMPNGNISTYLGFYRGNVRMPVSSAKAKTKEASPRVIGPKIKVTFTKKKEAIKPTYTVLHNEKFAEPMVVDGVLDEKVWKSIRAFRLKPLGAAPNLGNDIKAFVTQDHLYVGATLQDKHIWGTLKNRDDETWKEEVLEMFLDFNGDGRDYLELQITPHNTIFDANFKTTLSGKNRPEQIAKAKAFNIAGLESAVKIDGTLDDEKEDKGWTVEIKIPLKSIPGYSAEVTAMGSSWAINFYRFDRPEKGKSFAYAWSTEPAGNFHQVSKFGSFLFRPATLKTSLPNLGKPSQLIDALNSKNSKKLKASDILKQ